MIELVQAEPCWILRTSNPDLDEVHFATPAEAGQEAAKYPELYAGAEVVQLDRCCFVARCITCGEAEGAAECAGFHFSGERDDVLRQLGDLFVQADGTLVCEWCLEQSGQQRPETVVEPRRELQVDAETVRL